MVIVRRGRALVGRSKAGGSSDPLSNLLCILCRGSCWRDRADRLSGSNRMMEWWLADGTGEAQHQEGTTQGLHFMTKYFRFEMLEGVMGGFGLSLGRPLYICYSEDVFFID